MFAGVNIESKAQKYRPTEQDVPDSNVTVTVTGHSAVSHVIQSFFLTYGQTLQQRAGAFPASRKLDTSKVFREMQMKQSK
jgi:hypothetical protein